MKNSILMCLLFLSIVVNAQTNAKKLNKTLKVSSKEACEQKNGYWYNNKCWANFKEFDENVTKENVDKEVEKQLTEANKFYLQINGEKKGITFFVPSEEKSRILLFATYIENNKKYTLAIGAKKKDFKKSNGIANITFFNVDIFDSSTDQSKLKQNVIGTGKVKLNNHDSKDDGLEIEVDGTFTDSITKQITPIKAFLGEKLMGIGNTKIEIKGNEAYINGTLGTITYQQIKELIKNNPEVKTLVLQNVPGSMNDAINMHTGRIIREAGISTEVLSNSEIASGGVDLFCAGVNRIVHKGAKLGIHSWSGDGVEAIQLTKDHPAHQYQIAYFTLCLGKEIGPSFYFRTLEAAPAGDIHIMDDNEIKEKIATQFIN